MANGGIQQKSSPENGQQPFADPPQEWCSSANSWLESSASADLELRRTADQIVLSRCGPPGLIVDEQMRVLQSRGQIAQFMEIRPGTVNWSLRSVLPEVLAYEACAAVQRAVDEDGPASATAVLGQATGESHVQIEAFPLTSAAARSRCFLVLIRALDATSGNGASEARTVAGSAAHEKDSLIEQLRQDLALTRAYARSLLEEREARNGDRVAVNELLAQARIETRALNRTQDELRSLIAHLLNMEEQERQRVARELHDDISQRLSLLEIALQEMRADGTRNEDSNRLQTTCEQVHSLNTDLRRISHRLHSAILDDLGLSAALRAMLKEFGEREHMPVNYLTEDLPENWSSSSAAAVYSIAQEALRNVARHAGRTHVKLILAGKDSCLQLRVMDFGVGFDQEMEMPTRGLGMISMRERARLARGTLSVQSALGQGTTVTAEIPVELHE